MLPDLSTIQQWAQALGTNPAVLLVGYVLWREVRAAREDLLNRLERVEHALNTISLRIFGHVSPEGGPE